MVKLSPGDVIANCEPLVFVVDHTKKGKVCDGCYKTTSSLKRCSKCLQVFYCDADCQLRDWNEFHKHGECKYYLSGEFKAVPAQCNFIPRIHKRLVIGARHNGLRTKPVTMFDGSRRTLDDLPGTAASLERIADLDNSNFAFFAGDLLSAAKTRGSESDHLAVDMFAKANSNTFILCAENCFQDDSGPWGYAVYAEYTGFSHSCQPNAIGVNYGNKLQIRAIKNIDTDKEQITVDYLDWKRASCNIADHLKNLYDVKCKCNLCSNNQTEAMRQRYQWLRKESSASRDILIKTRLSLELVEQSKKTYGQYHRETAFAYYMMALFHGGEDSLLAKGLLKDLHESVRIAFGEDHVFYKIVADKFKNSPNPAKPTRSPISIDGMMEVIMRNTEHLMIGDKI